MIFLASMNDAAYSTFNVALKMKSVGFNEKNKIQTYTKVILLSHHF